jgi:hypothetical protein
MRKSIVLAVAAAALVAAIWWARAQMPQTACSVSHAGYQALPMKVSYDKAKGVLGCDGKLVSRQERGELVIETYAWRGTGWLYGRAEAMFIDNALEKKSFTSVGLTVNMESNGTDKGYQQP